MVDFFGFFCYEQKQPPELSYKKDNLRNFVKFKRKDLCQSLFFNKVAEHLWTTASVRAVPATSNKQSLKRVMRMKMINDIVGHAIHCVKSVQIQIFSGPYSSVSDLIWRFTP